MPPLRRYLDGLPRGGAGSFADALGISMVFLQQLASRQDGREPKPALAVSIEQKTFGAVRRWDLRPGDWHSIWPELIGTEGAPEPATPTEKAA